MFNVSLGEPIPLSYWTIPRRYVTLSDYYPSFFSPSGRLYFEKESERSFRVADLYSGNYETIDCPELANDFAYLPLSDDEGILYSERKFMRAKLDLEDRKLVADFDTTEKISYCIGSMSRLSDDSFGFFHPVGSNVEIWIRNLGAEAEEDKWIKIQQEYPLISFCKHGDSVIALTQEEYHIMMRYSLSEKRWHEGGFHRDNFENLDCEKNFWVDGKLFTATDDDYAIEFVVFDVIKEEYFLAGADHPDTADTHPDTHISTGDDGFIVVLHHFDRDSDEHKYRSFVIPFRKPLSLRLYAHLKLLNSAVEVENLPANDPVAPLFGRNRYRRRIEKRRGISVEELKIKEKRIE